MTAGEKSADLGHFSIVLVRPSDPRNIGFVCRAMKTMGITSLRIVSARPVNLARARVTAVHAKDLLDTVGIFPDLPAALADIALAAGVTRRRGKMRKYYSLFPEDFAKNALAIRKGRVALVFGTEEYGLTDLELSACHCAVNIPSSPLFPSLNLSHAVQIVCYAIFREAEKHRLPRFEPVDDRARAALITHAIGSLKPLGYFKFAEPKSLSILLNEVFARAALSKGELKRIETMFSKIHGLFIAQHKRLSAPSHPAKGAQRAH